jgi:hypothetical protein
MARYGPTYNLTRVMNIMGIQPLMAAKAPPRGGYQNLRSFLFPERFYTAKTQRIQS